MLAFLITWANVPYLFALGVAVLFALLQMSGVLGLLAGGGDHDGGHDAGPGDAHDAGGEGAADGGGHDGHEGHGDHDGHDGHDDHGGQGGPGSIWGWMGLGKVPLTLLWQTFAVAFALCGLAVHTAWYVRAGSLPDYAILVSLAPAIGVGLLTTRLLASSLSRILADPQQQATSRRELVGQTGVVISSQVGHEFGEVRIKDKTGHMVRLVCRVREREAPIPQGREVVVIDYDEGHLYVAPLS